MTVGELWAIMQKKNDDWNVVSNDSAQWQGDELIITLILQRKQDQLLFKAQFVAHENMIEPIPMRQVFKQTMEVVYYD